MKKLFAIALIATAMVACNNSGDKKEGETKDTTKVETPAPDTTVAPAPADTTAAPAPAPADTTATK